MAKVRPPAELAARPGDEELTVDELQKISLFTGLKEQPGMEEFPGTLILRRYRKGDVVCRIGEPGWTAFYILTSKDLEGIREGRLQKHLEPEPSAPGEQADGLRRVASVQSGLQRAPRRWNPFKHLFQRPPPSEAHSPPQEAFLTEGELFGEMSCLYRTPRSATVIVEQDCYMLELLRNILDKMLSNRNRSFKDQIDALYRKRVLELHVRSLPLFRDLPAEHLDRLCSKAELEALDPGELICDGHERSESMYIVRTGFVKTVKNASHLLGREDITDWQVFSAGLHAGSSEEAGPRRKVWDLLPEPVRATLTRAANSGELGDKEEQEIVNALNDMLKQPKLNAAAEFKGILQKSGLADEVKKLPASLKKWTNHQQICGFNYRLLSAIHPAIFPPRHSPDQVRVLSYRSQSDFIGEMGLLTGRPRSATCIAYDHPDSKFGRVELVRIGKQLFDEILSASPELRKIVADVVEESERRTRRIMSEPLWDDRNAATLSERFAELGLIQGQKLMLIDLDRCTRCDECVNACVATHIDGRSRLFLDGPLFKTVVGAEPRNFLVPATCRQCKDPVCLIGCPVGSIHKGENGQIVIEDWCIGCRRCAEQCPYSAIQMHAEGILPRQSRGWRYRAALVQLHTFS